MFKNKYLENCVKENKGTYYANNAYRFTINNNCDKLVVSDLGFIHNHKEKLEDFKKELIKANITEFILAEGSSALMKIIHKLDSVNIKIIGVEEVLCVNKWKEEKVVQGLLMQVIE